MKLLYKNFPARDFTASAAAGLMILFLGASAALGAEPDVSEFSFQQIWRMVRSASPSQKTALFEKQAAEIAHDRSARHWFPRVYADARFIRTNDPAAVFMSNLGQRSISQSDFLPDTLNSPGTEIYQRGTVGIDLPLYEGGMKISRARARAKEAESKGYSETFTLLAEFGQVASAYSEISVARRLAAELQEIGAGIDRILSRFQAGMASNPVEYAGMLGLRSLGNRIRSLQSGNKAKSDSYRTLLSVAAGTLPDGWDVPTEDAIGFADRHLFIGESARAGDSLRIRAYDAMAESASNGAESAKAVYLPRVGLFSEANAYHGDRDHAGSYNAGFYIQMNILSATDYGAITQAKLESDAARSRTREARLREKILVSQLLLQEKSIRDNIGLLKNSLGIMREQERNARLLFRNGSIKALQLVEILSRRVDILTAFVAAESEYISVRTQLHMYTNTSAEEANNGTK